MSNEIPPMLEAIAVVPYSDMLKLLDDDCVPKPPCKCSNPGCQGTGEGLLRCAACQLVWYCVSFQVVGLGRILDSRFHQGTVCQHADRDDHRDPCHAARDANARHSPVGRQGMTLLRNFMRRYATEAS